MESLTATVGYDITISLVFLFLKQLIFDSLGFNPLFPGFTFVLEGQTGENPAGRSQHHHNLRGVVLTRA